MDKIKINPANAGKLRRKVGAKKGRKIPVAKLKRTVAKAKKSGNVREEREAVFAENARGWAKPGRGLLGV